MARTVNPAQHAARKRHIQESAAVLFAELGYERTSTAQICRAAGVSSGSLYHYFGSKKAIFIAVLTDDQRDTAALLARGMHSEDRLRALLDFLDHLAAPAAEHPIVPKLVLEAMMQSHRDPEVREVLEQTDADEQQGIAALIRRAAETHDVDPSLDPDETAAWLGAIIGAVYLEAATNSAFDPARQLNVMRRTAEAYLTAGRASRR